MRPRWRCSSGNTASICLPPCGSGSPAPQTTLRVAEHMLTLRSLAFNVAFYAWTVGLTLVTLPFYFFLSQEKSMGVVRLWTGGMSWLLRTIAGTTYVVRGFENLPPGGALIACKHQSAWETLALVPILPNPT